MLLLSLILRIDFSTTHACLQEWCSCRLSLNFLWADYAKGSAFAPVVSDSSRGVAAGVNKPRGLCLSRSAQVTNPINNCKNATKKMKWFDCEPPMPLAWAALEVS